MKVMPIKKHASTKPAATKPFPSSDLLIEPAEELRKVLGVVALLATRGSITQNGCDPEAVFGSYELIEDNLREIHQALESAMETLDEASAPSRASYAAIHARKRKATVSDNSSSRTAA